MKLRNKKTGEIREDSDLGKMLIRYAMPSYDSIAELCEEWEDYKPAEPLIKGEKVRKAVRGWADYNAVKEVFYFVKADGSSSLVSYNFEINFFNEIGGLEDYKQYTITELCGEEEE